MISERYCIMANKNLRCGAGQVQAGINSGLHHLQQSSRKSRSTLKLNKAENSAMEGTS